MAVLKGFPCFRFEWKTLMKSEYHQKNNVWLFLPFDQNGLQDFFNYFPFAPFYSVCPWMQDQSSNMILRCVGLVLFYICSFQFSSSFYSVFLIWWSFPPTPAFSCSNKVCVCSQAKFGLCLCKTRVRTDHLHLLQHLPTHYTSRSPIFHTLITTCKRVPGQADQTYT